MCYSGGKSNPSRSPLKNLPMPRQAGQSLDEEIRDLVAEGVMPYLAMAVFVAMLALLEWARWFLKLPPHPVIHTFLAILAAAFSWWKISAATRKMHRLRQGRDGERAVAGILEDLLAQGYKVLHDLKGEGFNVDHLLIGPKGVFTVETKTRTLPARGRGDVHYDGVRVLVNGFEPDRDPVRQAKAQARWVRELVKDFTGKAVAVRPVVVFPGWYVNQTWRARPEVWVANPKALGAFIRYNDANLGAEEVRAIYAHLSRYAKK